MSNTLPFQNKVACDLFGIPPVWQLPVGGEKTLSVSILDKGNINLWQLCNYWIQISLM